ncbi:MAG: OmpA family protein [Candidatus Riflebacteria bacterium]|nr:OmpA family protein [Candidatus Riflebacteria bacterium]
MVDLEEDLPRIEKRVTFELNEWKVDPAGVELLTHVAALVKSHPGFEILIGGHTDRSTGTLDWNLRLSYLRATEVSRLLIERGVPADSLTVLGFGFTRPVRGAEEERTEEQKRLNRRVEFVNLGRKDGPGRSGAQ